MEPTYAVNVAGAVEYVMALAYLMLFVPFWRFVQGPATAASEPVRRARPTGWFEVPGDLSFHSGHTWARTEPDGLVTIGVDDFAQKLVGPLAAAALPQPGDELRQGEPGILLSADGASVDVLSPVTGRVVAVNPAIGADPRLVNRDPYGRGWLARVRPARAEVDELHWLTGALARRWMEEAAESVSARLQPELGLVLQDGGTPVDGLARAIAEEQWEEVARAYLRSPRRESCES
jgi:glycine cleavage system H lipoate-binding protein